MVRPRKIKGSLKVVPLNLDYEEYEKFIENIPRSMSVSEAIRDHIRSVNEEAEKQKNLNGRNHSAIGSSVNNIMQSKLDKYFPFHIQNWEEFKVVVKDLPEQERINLTKIWLTDFKLLELVNEQNNSSRRKVYPFLKI